MGFDKGSAPTYTSRPMRAPGVQWAFVLAAMPFLAFAQGGGEESSGSSSGTGETLGPAAPIDDPSQIPNDEKQKRVEQMLVESRQALKRGTDLLKEARQAKDILQLNCVNEKVTQIKGLLKIAEQSSIKMYDAIAQNAQDVVGHEFSKVALAHQKVTILKTEAERCVGEASIYTGDTEVLVEVDPNLREEDPTQPTPPPPGPLSPPVASAF